MKDNGLTVRRVGKGNFQGKMDAAIKEDGERIFNMAKENKHGRTVVTIKEIFCKVLNKERELINGLMEIFTKDNGKKTSFTVKER